MHKYSIQWNTKRFKNKLDGRISWFSHFTIKLNVPPLHAASLSAFNTSTLFPRFVESLRPHPSNRKKQKRVEGLAVLLYLCNHIKVLLWDVGVLKESPKTKTEVHLHKFKFCFIYLWNLFSEWFVFLLRVPTYKHFILYNHDVHNVRKLD